MFLSFTESQKLQKAQKAHQKKRKRLFCRVCGSRISDMRYLTSVDGGSPNRVFRNPNGYLYEIITLSDCEGLQDTSPPILEETWFPLGCASLFFLSDPSRLALGKSGTHSFPVLWSHPWTAGGKGKLIHLPFGTASWFISYLKKIKYSLI